MIKNRSRESAGHVANATIFVSWQVCYTGPGQLIVLASGCQTTLDVARVTSCILYLGTIVIDIRISEVGGVMANTTILVGIGMRRTGCFASGIDRLKTSIMTRNTVTCDTGVIEGRGNERRVIMTEMAILIGWQMVCTLAGQWQ